MTNLTGKIVNRSSLDSNRGGYGDGSVAKFQDYSVSNENYFEEVRLAQI